MLSSVVSRAFCQVVAKTWSQIGGVSCISGSKSYPSLGSVIRTLKSSSPARGGISDNVSVVTYSQLKTMLSTRDIQLFDVRNPDEYRAGHIPDSVNIPLGNLEDSLKLSPKNFEQKFEVKAPGKEDDNLVFYCKSGVRSSTALNIAHQLGFKRARHYKGGFTEWTEQEGK